MVAQLIELSWTRVFFGVRVCPMTVWREVQRLGEACEQYTLAQARYHADANCDAAEPSEPPAAVVLGVDGCALGMQVRETRRRRQGSERLPPLAPVEDGHFREVKTGLLLLPSERLEPTPGRHSVVRRFVCTCLGHLDDSERHLLDDRTAAIRADLPRDHAYLQIPGRDPAVS